jgi:uncharacterized protein YndB with AHSA1/START domain
MKFVAVETISAPIDHVWSRLTDFDLIEEKMAAQMGPVSRMPDGPVRPGTNWAARMEIMGKPRDVTIRLEAMAVPERVAARGDADGVEIALVADLEAVTEATTRLTVMTEAAAKGIGAKVALKAAKVAQGSLEKRYAERIAAFATSVAESHAPTA